MLSVAAIEARNSEPTSASLVLPQKQTQETHVFTGKIYTLAETHLICRRVAVGLSRIGVGKGDIVMALLQNCAEFVLTFMGASMIRAVTTTANSFCMTKEIFKQFSASRSKVIVTQSQFVDKLRDLGDDSIVFGKDFKVVAMDSPPEGCLPFSILSEWDEVEKKW